MRYITQRRKAATQDNHPLVPSFARRGSRGEKFTKKEVLTKYL
jgi:hypothetical protein